MESKKPVIVIDFGAQYSQLIARRIREANIYSEVISYKSTIAEILGKNPAAIILSGGPESVYEEFAPTIDQEIFNFNIPILGICYGFQITAHLLGGKVHKAGLKEYGATAISVSQENILLDKIPNNFESWMSHGDSVVMAPKDFITIANTFNADVAAFANDSKKIYGVQWHPEVAHSEFGQQIIENFLYKIAEIAPRWNSENFVTQQVEHLQQKIGKNRVICALSGGVDSAVAAALVARAVGNQLTCIFVDHGFLRLGEAEQVSIDYVEATGAKLHVVEVKKHFLDALYGVVDPEEKRKIIGREFIRIFEAKALEIAANNGEEKVKFLVQGTLYPDVIESGNGGGNVIKTHHNTGGGIPEDIEFEIIEPLRDLFKDEVRKIGAKLGLPKHITHRHPFPGPGLSIRIIGEVTQERLDILRKADHIANMEISKAGLEDKIWQMPLVLLADIKSVGIQGDGRTYGYPVVLRPVSSEDAMTADWVRLPYEILASISNRITNEVPEINRVVLDITSKPPATIEWE